MADRKVAQLKVLLAYHEPPFASKLAHRKVTQLKVLLAYHETSIRDQAGQPKGCPT